MAIPTTHELGHGLSVRKGVRQGSHLSDDLQLRDVGRTLIARPVTDALIALAADRTPPPANGVRAERSATLPNAVDLQGGGLEADMAPIWRLRFTTAEAADAFIARLSASTTPDPELPEGGRMLSGIEVAEMLRAGQSVEQWSTNGYWLKLYDPDWWEEHIGARTIVARPVRAAPAAVKVPLLEAISSGRVLIGADGTHLPTDNGNDVVVYRKGDRWCVMYDDASHPEESRVVAAPDGTVEVLPLPEDGAR